jgi:hypothetical protein
MSTEIKKEIQLEIGLTRLSAVQSNFEMRMSLAL